MKPFLSKGKVWEDVCIFLLDWVEFLYKIHLTVKGSTKFHQLPIFCCRSDNLKYLGERIRHLESACRTKLRSEDFKDSFIDVEVFLNLRYEGTDCALMCAPASALPLPDSPLSHPRRRSSRRLSSATEEGESLVVPGYGSFKRSFLDRW